MFQLQTIQRDNRKKCSHVNSIDRVRKKVMRDIKFNRNESSKKRIACDTCRIHSSYAYHNKKQQMKVINKYTQCCAKRPLTQP